MLPITQNIHNFIENYKYLEVKSNTNNSKVIRILFID